MICNHDDEKLNGRRAIIKSHILTRKTSFFATKEGDIKLQLLGSDQSELLVKLDNVILPQTVTIIDDELFFASQLPASPIKYSARKGRVTHYYDHDQTVSVMFGCDTGKHKEKFLECYIPILTLF
jgi:hypothetical protein